MLWWGYPAALTDVRVSLEWARAASWGTVFQFGISRVALDSYKM
jgi:hypothetical protein